MYGDSLPVSVPVLAVADPSVDETEVTESQTKEHVVAAGEPRYLSIPSLGVYKARVFGTDVTESGALGAPKNLSDIAWYTKSATPGSDGVMLMDGHNGGITRNGVLAKLGTLQKSDIIEVERGDGRVFRYEVRENQSMDLEEVNTTGMKMMMQSAEVGKEALNLITCDGKWIPRYKQFDRRIMLRAVLVE
jgi:sortase (surface protein transpeptidase)